MTSKRNVPAKQRQRAGGAPSDGRPFGPAFFVQSLRQFLRYRCPDPGEHLPILEVGLHDGVQLRICHVIALSHAWVALAVADEASTQHVPLMQTVIVPYESIVRVSIRAAALAHRHLGFTAEVEPTLLVERSVLAEAMLRDACCAPGAHAPGRASVLSQGARPARGKGDRP